MRGRAESSGQEKKQMLESMVVDKAGLQERCDELQARVKESNKTVRECPVITCTGCTPPYPWPVG